MQAQAQVEEEIWFRYILGSSNIEVEEGSKSKCDGKDEAKRKATDRGERLLLISHDFEIWRRGIFYTYSRNRKSQAWLRMMKYLVLRGLIFYR